MLKPLATGKRAGLTSEPWPVDQNEPKYRLRSSGWSDRASVRACRQALPAFLTTLLKALASIILSLLLYLAYWGVIYRIPGAPAKIVDLRPKISTDIGTNAPARYITFCASLAGNAHGFPGHSYVVWNATPAASVLHCEAVGFVPTHVKDQIRSLYMPVPGMLASNASVGNTRNLSSLTVIVDDETYERTRRLRQKWDASRFQAGVHDCVAFQDFIAREVGLSIPDRNKFFYPQDHIAELKRLNSSDRELRERREAVRRYQPGYAATSARGQNAAPDQ